MQIQCVCVSWQQHRGRCCLRSRPTALRASAEMLPCQPQVSSAANHTRHRANAQTQAHVYASTDRNVYSPASTHARTHARMHGKSIMRDRDNKWQMCVSVVALFIKVQGTECACNQQEAFRANTHTHTLNTDTCTH